MKEWRDHLEDVEGIHPFCAIRTEGKPRGRDGFYIMARDEEQAAKKAAILWPGEQVKIEPWGDRK